LQRLALHCSAWPCIAAPGPAFHGRGRPAAPGALAWLQVFCAAGLALGRRHVVCGVCLARAPITPCASRSLAAPAVSLALLQLHRIADGKVHPRTNPAPHAGSGPLGESIERGDSAQVPPPADANGDAPRGQQGDDGSGEDYFRWSGQLRRADSQSAWDQLQAEADAVHVPDQHEAMVLDDPDNEDSAGAGRRRGGLKGGKLAPYAAAGAPPPPPRSPSAASVWSVGASKRQQRVHDRVAGLPSDPSKLFWFGKPSLLLYVSPCSLDHARRAQAPSAFDEAHAGSRLGGRWGGASWAQPPPYFCAAPPPPALTALRDLAAAAAPPLPSP
jgi:hypothetical protein